MDTWVIKLPQADRAEEPILIRVSRKAGGQKLDLDLLATDGESAWRTKLRERKLDVYRAENYESTSEDWSSILQYALIFPPNVVLPSAQRDSLGVTCKQIGKGSKRSLTITLQTHVEDISRRLGTIELSYSENTEDIDLFGWTTQAVQTRDDISSKLRERETRLDQAESQIDSLKNHLDELIAAKEEHETQLLSKFALLLNEKKLRIRTQQRQLAEADRPSRAGTSTRTTKVSRKRKQDAKPQASDTGEESEGFEAMDIDSIHDAVADQDSDQAQMTSSGTDTDTDDGASLAKHTAAIPGQQPRSARSPTPPPRSLPFGKSSEVTKAQTEKPADTGISKADEGDEETASEDDEL